MGGVLSKLSGRGTSRVAGIGLRALRQGLLFGTKVRFPHSIVIAALFRFQRGAVVNLLSVSQDTWEHARNLAYFAALYKVGIVALRALWAAAKLPETATHEPLFASTVAAPLAGSWLENLGGFLDLLADGARSVMVSRPSHPLQALVAGGVASSLVWAKFSHVNYQILLYVLARTVLSAIRILSAQGVAPFSQITFQEGYPWMAIVVWALVMMFFEFFPDQVQSSMRRSMEALYHSDSSPASVEDVLPSPMFFAVAAFLFTWTWRRGGLSALSRLFQVHGSTPEP
jgi:peroxisomal membrane protein 4